MRKKIIGLCLTVCPVVLFIGWVLFSLIMGLDNSPDKPQLYIESLGDNSTLVKSIFPLLTLLFFIIIGGLGFIRNSMKEGSGHFIGGFGLLFMVIGASGFLTAAALQMSVSNAASTTFAGWAETAQTLFAASNSIGSLATVFMFLGFSLIGLGILIQRNFHLTISATMVISGIYTAAISLNDYSNPMVIIGYAGFCLSTSALGLILIRSSDK